MKKSALWFLCGLVCGISVYAFYALGFPQFVRWGTAAFSLVCIFFFLSAVQSEKVALHSNEDEQNG
jgi:uncharacterized membrane protein YjfL (UPF0719 family)